MFSCYVDKNSVYFLSPLKQQYTCKTCGYTCYRFSCILSLLHHYNTTTTTPWSRYNTQHSTRDNIAGVFFPLTAMPGSSVVSTADKWFYDFK